MGGGGGWRVAGVRELGFANFGETLKSFSLSLFLQSFPLKRKFCRHSLQGRSEAESR
jgi:hypothetical protein